MICHADTARKALAPLACAREEGRFGWGKQQVLVKRLSVTIINGWGSEIEYDPFLMKASTLRAQTAAGLRQL